MSNQNTNTNAARDAGHSPAWYAGNTGNHQGLIIEESTGRNVAVAYDKEDAPLIAAAPALLAALRSLVAIDDGDRMLPQEFAAEFDAARAAISAATGAAS